MSEQKDTGLAYQYIGTSRVIRWGQLVSVLKKAPPPLTDRERCDLILDVANGKPLRPKQWARLMGVGMVRPGKPFALEPSIRALLVENLNSLITSDATERRQYEALLEDRLRDSVLQTAVRTPHVIAFNALAATYYGLLVMLKSGLAEELHCCGYSPCSAYFFERPAKGGTGAPNRTYCRPSHVKPGKLESARKRMKRLRGTPA